MEQVKWTEMTEKRLTRLEEIVLNQPEVAIRIALAGAVFFAEENPEEFERKYGKYGMEGIKLLLNERRE